MAMTIRRWRVQQEARRSGDRQRHTSMTTRLAASVIVVGFLSLAVTTAIAVRVATSGADSLRDAKFDQVLASRERVIVADDRSLRGGIERLASSPATEQAIERFADAFDEIVVDADDRGELSNRLTGRYEETLVPVVEQVRGRPVNVAELVPDTGAGLYLQDLYGRLTPDEDSTDDAGDGSTWSEAHADLHQAFVEVAEGLDLADVLLVDASGRVVYSVAKHAEFATNLSAGPFSGSALGSLIKSYRSTDDDGVRTTDWSSYLPAADRPVRFAAAPVRSGSRLVGFVVGEASIDAFNDLVSGDDSWDAAGLGETGEVIVVGTDGVMRSDARLFRESPRRYVDQAAEAGTISPADGERMLATGTTALVQTLRNDVIDAWRAADQSPPTREPTEVTDELGRRVLASSGRVAIDDVDWVIIAQMVVDEARSNVDSMRSDPVVAMTIAAAVLAIAAVVWAWRVVAPVRRMGDALHAGERPRRSGPGTPPPGDAALPGADDRDSDAWVKEFADLEVRLAAMQEQLRSRRAEVEAAQAERSRLMRTLLPPRVAVRIEAGERDVLEHVPRATIVVIVFHGLDRLVEGLEIADGRAWVAGLVDELDALGGRHGVERIKLLGDAYFAACGHDQPYPDQAPRAVTFASKAVEMIASTGADPSSGVDPGAAAAVETGAVTVGLNGSARLVYDVWGDTVSRAYLLARDATPSSIVITDAVRVLLPESVTVEPWGSEDARGFRVTSVLETVGRETADG